MRSFVTACFFLAIYLVIDAAAAGNGLTLSDSIGGALSSALALFPLTFLRTPKPLGLRRVAFLCEAVALFCAATLGPAETSVLRESFLVIGLVTTGYLTLELSLSLPVRAPEWVLRPVFAAAALITTSFVLAAVFPAFEAFGVMVVAGAIAQSASLIFVSIGFLVSFVIRIRRFSWATIEHRAANLVATLGLVPIGLLSLIWLITSLDRGFASWREPLETSSFVFVALSSGLALVASQVTLLDPTKRPQAGPQARTLISFAIPAGMIATTSYLIAPSFDPSLLPWLGLCAAGATLGLWVLTKTTLMRWLSPWRGRLIEAVNEAKEALRFASDLSELGGAVLTPINRALCSRDLDLPDGSIVLFSPARSLRASASGSGVVRHAEPTVELELFVADHPQEVILIDEFRRRMVRETELREVTQVLESQGVICAIPLGRDVEIEGVLLVPRGQRKRSLTLEEVESLRDLGRQLSAKVVLLTAQQRAFQRLGGAVRQVSETKDQVDALEEALDRVRASEAMVRAGRGRGHQMSPSIAYSPAMKAFSAELKQVANLETPLTLHAEAGLNIAKHALNIHRLSGRRDGPFVTADASSVNASSARALLFGTSNRRGWLELSNGGTLFLVDFPALPSEVQSELAEALSLRQGRHVDEEGLYPIDFRLIATSRLPLDDLRDEGAIDDTFYRWVAGRVLTVPPLREREEDLSSLILLAIDRACRVHGRQPVGITQGSLELLSSHQWLGNVRELQHVLDQAVLRCDGQLIRREDLPDLTSDLAQQDPLEGSFEEVESRILKRALEQAQGNKSEAARKLGLKRTTFVNKLKRAQERDL